MHRPTATRLVLSKLLLVVFTLALTGSMPAQTFTVLYNFTGGQDGAGPRTGLTVTGSGKLYGTAANGGNNNCSSGFGCGTVFQLTRNGSGWSFASLHAFQGADGAFPNGEVAIGSDGSLYGTTEFGGSGTICSNGCGTIYNVRPSANASDAGWTEAVLYRFTGGQDGAAPMGPITFDVAGGIYVSAAGGGIDYRGVIAKLTPSEGGWTESALYEFPGYGEPTGGVIFDQLGNLYGTTLGSQEVFQLAPSDSGWTEQTLRNFAGTAVGQNPFGGLLRDSAGSLYGTTWQGGAHNAGTVFQLSPSGDGGRYSLLYSFQSGTGFGLGPTGALTMDAAGSLYGTTYADGAHGAGSVFKLTPSNGGWVYTSLHDFSGGSDGGTPNGRVVFDSNGNLYGTAQLGGTGSSCVSGCGVVWEITP
jgi:uncharacterized repeat protein (TIGR03803 family)